MCNYTPYNRYMDIPYIGWKWKFLFYWLSSSLAHAPMLVRYQIVKIRKRINNHFYSMVQGLGGKVMLQYTGLAKKILDVLRPTQWSALFLNAFKMSWNPAIHCALYTTIGWILLFFCREWIHNIRSNPKNVLWNTNLIKMDLLIRSTCNNIWNIT